MIRIVAILIALFFTHAGVYCQSYQFKHYQVENGLSNNTVQCSVQDDRGFMWFGTKDGLNRFDGYNFKTFRHDAGDSTSLDNNFIRGLYKGPNGKIYIGSSAGISVYNEGQENFTELVKTRNTIREMVEDTLGNLWYSDGLELKCYIKKTKQVHVYKNDEYGEVNTVCRSADGTIWAGTTNGYLKKYNAATNHFIYYDVFAHSAPTTLRWIEKIYADDNGNILIGTTNHGLKIFNIKDSSCKGIFDYNTDKTAIFVRDIIQSAADEYWIATESGLFIYNSQTGNISNLQKHYNNPYSLSDNAIYTVHKDKEGGVWAGTYFGGINYYPKQYYSFEKYFPDYSPHAISGNAVREICEDKYGYLWIGTEDGGLNKFNKQTGGFKKFTPTGKPSDIAYFNIHGLLCDGDTLWIGSFEHGLDIMDIKTEKIIKHYSAGAEAAQLKSNFILSICKTKNGIIYVATSRGLYRYNAAEDNFTFIDEIPDYVFAHSITEDHNGNLWIPSFGNGVYKYDPATGKSVNFRYNPKDKGSIGSNTVTTVFEDDKQRIWIGTEGGGLCLLNKDGKTFTAYSTGQGFPSNTVFKILEDKKKNLWVTTTRGLVCFNPDKNLMRIYTKANGLLNDQFNYNSGYKDSTGKMYFGSVKGLIAFNPDSFINNNYVPPVYITGFQVNNAELVAGQKHSPLQQSVSLTNKIKLPYNQSSFSIDFAALSFTAPETIEYAYKMEGLDEDWTYIKANRKVYFTNLAPGNYMFKVKAATNSGKWANNTKEIEVEILPPFWATTWAYVIYTLLTAAIVYWLMRMYHNRQAEKNNRKMELMAHEKEKELYQAKIEFFTNVAHEIRTPLTLIKAPMEKLMKHATDMRNADVYLKTMEKNTNRLVDLTNELLDFRKTETKGFSLNFTKINITTLLEDMYTNFQTIAEQRNIEYSLDLPKQPVYAYADEEALNKILSNLLNNAIKYALKKVRLRLLPDAEHAANIVIEIENDGYVIPEALKEKVFEPFFRVEKTKHQTGSGIGLALSRSLAALHKGRLYMKEGDLKMNVFVLVLPLNQRDLQD
ncbi:ligand-binding sensor domain-containing protein [Parafilimonas sp.]|uniref:ligand-binding sensor domain-containing protein n=1 Tax=Parafilimonas sp. TaxID=1969739 RepID=UPI0039E6B537